ncbi:murein hydrolase activator EnvC family protein [Sphingomonas lenta]|uniref:Metalloendopeptidase n=1 Tax=Sphingomonas lenta TaxID=1141887 RepID=A0A2A2SFZ4_9SPHN|nr:peptidoglycan DD-metalloendopeptidase family protein [Sphingomonas lenta]PAX08123.1 metalloendopeptidase [Sphingomonas lenta]
MAAALALAGSVGAQAPDLASQQRRLADAKREAAAADARAEALARSAQAEKDAAARAAADERALAARVAAAQAELRAAQARVAVVDDLLRAQRARLSEVQAPAARLLAALQSMARRPAIAAVAQPGSVDDLVHLRAVLGGALPVVEARAATVRDEVARTRRLQEGAALAARALRDARGRLEADRVALAQAEARHRARAQVLGRGALSESDRALALGEQARDIVDRLAAQGEAQVTGKALAALPAPSPRPVASPAPEGMAGGAYRLPVAGRLVTGFEAVSSAGVRSRGLTFAVRPGTMATAPAAGVVRYARPYRGYGTVVVIDHGEGWSTTLIGLGRAAVKAGAQVAAGAPVGQAPAGDQPEVTVELRRRGRPVDIVALL